ncbi:MAG: hypothetical protein PHQ19_03880 [Candidatus Krumholzibacteria bacterium]|nr:hypothetical protein [Candidatus Krumholzibacteria bacterium]
MNFREKHQERRPRDLHDISHLFLSSAHSAAVAAPPHALVALACADDGPWRAFAGAGLARALESAGLDVTLLETGRALPNAGFYFALGPGAYLRPVLDPRAVVSGPPAGPLRFHYARDPSRLPLPPREGGVPGRARIVIFAFSRSAVGTRPAVPSIFRDLLSATSGREPQAPDGSDPHGGRVALVTAGPDDPDRYLGAVRGSFEEEFPGAPVLALYGADGGDDPGAARGAITAGMARRCPPALDLFGGIAASLLQRLARGREAAG